MVRSGLDEAENENGSNKSRVLNKVASTLSNAPSASNNDKVMELARVIRDLSSDS